MEQEKTGHMSQSDWEAKAKSLLKAEIKRKDLTYKQLVQKLADIGVSEQEGNIRNKLSRGKFNAVYMLQILTAIGCTNLALQ